MGQIKQIDLCANTANGTCACVGSHYVRITYVHDPARTMFR